MDDGKKDSSTDAISFIATITNRARTRDCNFVQSITVRYVILKIFRDSFHLVAALFSHVNAEGC